ncbi:MAG: alpha-L-fucosidase [Verrucomicrobiota bacterium]
MKALLLVGALAGGLASNLVESPVVAAGPASAPANAARLEWWREARFGMFIHWGPVSLKGTEIGWSRGAEIPIAEYDTLYQRFNPTNFNAEAWVKIARDAGMKYLVFTTKHHDGFCMWDTKQTDHNIMRSPFGRDVVKELAAACRGQGLAFGTYHSVTDWHHPDFPLTSPGGSVRRETSNLDRYEQYLRAQVSELITNYGPLLVMWFDVPQEFSVQRGQGLIDFVRALQPDIIVNDRSGARGDYDTPEQRVGKFQNQRPWETCMTICHQWAWKPGDEMKSLQECIQTLVLCAGGDGNLLFNVGPMPDGRIEPRQAERLQEMGAWLKRYGESVYGTRGGPWKPSRAVASTRKGNSIFVHLLRPAADTVTLPDIPARIVGSLVLTGGSAKVSQAGGQVTIALGPQASSPPVRGAETLRPPPARQEIDTIVRLELDRSAMDLEPVGMPGSVKASASNVFQNMEEYTADKAFDGDPATRWATDAGTRQAWIAVDLGRPRRLTGVRIREEYAGRVQRFELQRKEGQEWQTIFAGTTLGQEFSREFPPLTAQELRLNILEATEGPTISEIEFVDEK